VNYEGAERLRRRRTRKIAEIAEIAELVVGGMTEAEANPSCHCGQN